MQTRHECSRNATKAGRTQQCCGSKNGSRRRGQASVNGSRSCARQVKPPVRRGKCLWQAWTTTHLTKCQQAKPRVSPAFFLSGDLRPCLEEASDEKGSCLRRTAHPIKLQPGFLQASDPRSQEIGEPSRWIPFAFPACWMLCCPHVSRQTSHRVRKTWVAQVVPELQLIPSKPCYYSAGETLAYGSILLILLPYMASFLYGLAGFVSKFSQGMDCFGIAESPEQRCTARQHQDAHAMQLNETSKVWLSLVRLSDLSLFWRPVSVGPYQSEDGKRGTEQWQCQYRNGCRLQQPPTLICVSFGRMRHHLSTAVQRSRQLWDPLGILQSAECLAALAVD